MRSTADKQGLVATEQRPRAAPTTPTSGPTASGAHARALRRAFAVTACALALLAPGAVASARTPSPGASCAPAAVHAAGASQITAGLEQPAARAAHPQVVLAEAHGLRLSGRPEALRGRPAPALESLSAAQAEGLAALPARNLYFRGADCEWPGRTSRFGSPVTLTFTLPRTLFREETLPLFRLNGHSWTRLPQRAVVGAVNSTASATITRGGSYALCLSRDWKTVTSNGETLVQFDGHVPRTAVLDPQVQASGTTDDPQVIAAVMKAADCSEAQAKSTLLSFADSALAPVQVITLRHPAAMQRYWSSNAVGRWFTPSGSDKLLSPSAARRLYALPADNTAENVSLHLVKGGAALVTGRCADMTEQSGYGPYATGGGLEYFGPKVSTYPPPLYDPAMTVVLCDLRWQKDAVDGVVW